MFSLRPFARAAPKSSVVRLAISARPQHLSRFYRPTIRSSLRPTALCIPRGFSTTATRRDDVSQELAAKLNSEIALEQENSTSETDSDTNVQAFLQQHDYWTLESNPGEQDVVLRRQYDDETITVAFSIIDFNTPAMMDDEADEAFMDEEDFDDTTQSGGNSGAKGAINSSKTSPENASMAAEDSVAPADREALRDEEDFDSQQAFPASVHVLIQRPGKGALRANLVADNGKWTIHGLTHLPAGADDAAAAAELIRHTPSHAYTGPPFQQLDEEVQSLLEQYLEVRGINTALALFVPDYIDVKEQHEYQGWLERVKEFVE